MEPRDKNFQPQGQQVPAPHDHEHSDINVRGIFAFVVFLLVSGVLINIVLYAMLHFLEKNYEETQAAATARTDIQVQKPDQPIHATGDNQLPPAALASSTRFERELHSALNDRIKKFPPPRVQPDDIYDMAVYRYSVDAKLHCGKIPGLLSRSAHGATEGGKTEGGHGEGHGAATQEANPAEQQPSNCVTIDQALDQVAQNGLPSRDQQGNMVRATSAGNIALPSRGSTNHPKAVLQTNTYGQTLVVPSVPITPPGGSASYAADNPGQYERIGFRGMEPGSEHQAGGKGKGGEATEPHKQGTDNKGDLNKSPEPKH